MKHRDVERFKECRRCRGTNTDQIGMADDYNHLQFVGWCFDCKDDYGYWIDVDTIWDKERRI